MHSYYEKQNQNWPTLASLLNSSQRGEIIRGWFLHTQYATVFLALKWIQEFVKSPGNYTIHLIADSPRFAQKTMDAFNQFLHKANDLGWIRCTILVASEGNIRIDWIGDSGGNHVIDIVSFVNNSKSLRGFPVGNCIIYTVNYFDKCDLSKFNHDHHQLSSLNESLTIEFLFSILAEIDSKSSFYVIHGDEKDKAWEQRVEKYKINPNNHDGKLMHETIHFTNLFPTITTTTQKKDSDDDDTNDINIKEISLPLWM